MFNHHLLTSVVLMMSLNIAILMMGPCHAQITTDGTLGPALNLPGPDYQITPDLGQQRGGNLFHSFQDFNLQRLESATFSGPNSVQNVISRVTGSNSSYLDGTIRSLIPSANFYFLNPYGIMLGPNAKLAVDGAFHLSSTDSLVFTDGYEFDAYAAEPLLTVAAPEGFGFLNQMGEIRIEGNRLENGEKDFSVTAGNLTINGSNITSTTGSIEIKSQTGNLQIINSNIGSATQDGQSGSILLQAAGSIEIRGIKIEITNQAGEKVLSTIGDITTTTRDGQAGNIFLQAAGSIVIIGSGIVSETEQGGSGHAGNVTLDSPQIYLDSYAQMEDGSIIKLGGAQVGTRTRGSGKGGDVQISAEQLFLINDSAVFAETWGSSLGGDLVLNVGLLELRNNGRISTSSQGQGQSGQINITATNSVAIIGNKEQEKLSAAIDADASAQGKGGDIILSSPVLSIDAGILRAVTLENSEGNAGHIELKIDRLVLKNGGKVNVSSVGKGDAGNITITGLSNEKVDTIEIVGYLGDNPSGIASSAFCEGDGGTIRISAKTVNLDQRGTLQTLTEGEGKAGDIILNVQKLTITQGADIDASNEGTNPEKGGNITIHATGTVFITAEPGEEENKPVAKEDCLGTTVADKNENDPIVKEGYLGGIYSVAGEKAGTGGDVTLSARELIMREGGAISLGSQGLGNAGHLKLSITDNLRMNNAAIITRATKAGGGNIEIGTPHEIHLINSKITAEAGGKRKQDHGGNLTIRNLGLFTLDNSQLVTNAYAGNGGDINLETPQPQFKVLNNSQIEASSELGFHGEFILNSIKLKDDFLNLPPPQFQGLDLSLDRCAGLTRDTISQFVITIRDVLPPSPTDLKTHYFFP